MNRTVCSFDKPNRYDFWGTLRFLRFGIGDPTTTLTKNSFQQARWYPSGPASLRLNLAGQAINAEAVGPGAQEAIDSAHDLLGLSDHPAKLTGDPAAERIALQCQGIRLGRCASFASQLVTIILQLRIEWQQAASQWRRLCYTLGDDAPCGTLRLPAHADALRHASLLQLRRLNIAEQQARTLKEVGRLFNRIDQWAAHSVGELRHRLGFVRGIGPWSTEMTLALYWAESDAVPLGDYALPHSVAYALTGAHRSDDAHMLKLLEPFRPDRGRLIRWIMGSNIAPPRRSSRARRMHDY